MIDSNSKRSRSSKHKKFNYSGNGDISPIINGQKLVNGDVYYKSEEETLNKSWSVMNYEDYVKFRPDEEKSSSDSLFGNTLYDFTWDLAAEIHNRRHGSPGKSSAGTTNLNTNDKEGATTPGFIFRFYKKFGFYWNVFPKTDYCYLPGSPDYKKEISPGIPKVPNLSRYPLSSYVTRGVGLRSRNTSSYDTNAANLNCSSANTSFADESFKTSTKLETSNSQRMWENVEARQNIINNILSRQARRRSTWRSVKSVVHTFLMTIKRKVVMLTTESEEVTSSTMCNRNLPLLLFLLLLLLPLLYFFIPGYAQKQDEVESLPAESTFPKFLSWISNCFTSFLYLVRDSLLYIPTICQQLLTLFTSFYNHLFKNETVNTKNTFNNIGVPIPANLSRQLTKEELIALQSGIIDKIKQELAGQEHMMSARIDKLQEQMKLLTENMKKMSGSFEADWAERFDKLEEEIKLELADVRKSVNDFGEKAIGIEAPPSDMVKKAVAKYHADRTGKPDYALQSSGGYVVRVRCTQTYTKTTGNIHLFGIPLPWNIINGPDTIIKPGVMPGECWAFEGSFAQVTLHLATKVKITGFSLEHSPKELAPHGHISSAPKQFSVWALESEEDENPVFLGRFTFLDNGESLQQFDAIEYDKEIGMVELKIESNHGHPEYTCLYRFRVHGVPSPVEERIMNNTADQGHGSIPH